jgi:hypothetical protein
LASIANKSRAPMSAENVPTKIRYKVWVKAFQHATDMDGLIVTTIEGKTATRYEHWCGRLPKWVKHLRTWGESGTVKVKTDTTPKIVDRGIQCMFVGYSKDHDGDCIEMWYPKTNKVYTTTRDVIWLNKMYYNAENIEGVTTLEGLDCKLDETDVNATPTKEDKATTTTTVEETIDSSIEHEEPPAIEDGTTRSGMRFRDIAAANLVFNPVE